MKKLTRKTFNRKVVAVGLSTFIGLGLVSTGFAAWVMSMGAETKPEGNVQISTVTDVSISLTAAVRDDENLAGDETFVFDARKEDETGRVKFGQDPEVTTQTTGENLTIVFDVTVSPVSSLGKLMVQITLPEGVQNAVDEGYLVAPTCTATPVTLYEYKEDNANGVHNTTAATGWTQTGNSATFSYAVTFGWGEKFGGMNPGDYYDTDTNGLQVADEDVKTQVQAFQNMLLGTPSNQAAIDAAIALNTDSDPENDVTVPAAQYNLKYIVTFTATAR